jgi:serine protease AprX
MAVINKWRIVVLLLLVQQMLYGQDKHHLIYFTDKNNSPYQLSDPEAFLSTRSVERKTRFSIELTEQDLPVVPAYIEAVAQTGATVLYTLKWPNAVVVRANTGQLEDIALLSFVQNHKRISRMATDVKSTTEVQQANQYTALQGTQSLAYGGSYTQIRNINADHMHEDGYTGQGILIALLDGGFRNASSVAAMEHLYTQQKIVATYDFVDLEENVYDDHEHGLNVWSVVGAYAPGSLIGSAYGASYILLRTEDVMSETPLEEANWARAVEYADSLGVDIVNSSLGYTTFDNPADSYTYQDMDGQTSLIAAAAEAAAERGILVINSAGNEGAFTWKYITTPADAPSVLAIGATNQYNDYVYFSSIGPTSDGRIKPDLSAMGENILVATASGGLTSTSGTSFSCPLVAGLAAGVWEAYPQLSSRQLADLLRRSASQYTAPDNKLGYGVPSYTRVKEYMQDSAHYNKQQVRIFPNPFVEGKLYLGVEAARLGQEARLVVTDVLGRTVAEDQLFISGIHTETRLLADSFQAGIYMVRIYFSDQTVLEKFIKN